MTKPCQLILKVLDWSHALYKCVKYFHTQKNWKKCSLLEQEGKIPGYLLPRRQTWFIIILQNHSSFIKTQVSAYFWQYVYHAISVLTHALKVYVLKCSLMPCKWMGENSLSVCSAEAACVWLDPPSLHIGGGGVPFFWLCALCLWIRPRPTIHWHSDKSLISHLILVLDIAGRSNDSSSTWSSEIWYRNSLVYLSPKSSAYLPLWLVETCTWCPCALTFFLAWA